MSNKKVLYIDMDNVLVDFQSGIDQFDEATRVKYKNDLDEVPGIFSLMKPKEGAIEAFNELSEAFDTYILSTAPWKNPTAWSDKLRWVHEHLGESAYKRLILTHHKDLNAGDFLVDDRDKNGAKEFLGEWIKFDPEQKEEWSRIKAYLLGKQ